MKQRFGSQLFQPVAKSRNVIGFRTATPYVVDASGIAIAQYESFWS